VVRRLAVGLAFVVAVTVAALAAGCGAGAGAGAVAVRGTDGGGVRTSAVWLGARPIGRRAEFHPPARGPIPGRCRSALGARDGVHVEVFARNRVVLVPAGIGLRGPLRFSAGRIAGARCYGDLVTLEPTGVVLVRRGARVVLSQLFRAWGQPLSGVRVGPFRAPRGTGVAVFVGGRRWTGTPARVRLTRHAEIVLEVGPYVPPHTAYTFPPGL